LLAYDSNSKVWINKKIADIFKDYLPTITETTILTINNDDNNDHNALLTQESETQTFVNGDIIIIKDPIANNKY
jgi:FMN-dependent NADH-azoreductase